MQRLVLAVSAIALISPAALAQDATPATSAVQAGGAATELANYRVLFGFDSAELTPAAQDVISEAAGSFRAAGADAVTIVGHTDTSGNPAYNLALSERRANAVSDALISAGVPAGAIEIDALGERDLLVETGDQVPESMNRRVDIQFLQPAAEVPAVAAAAPVAAAAAPAFKRLRAGLGPYYGFDLGPDQHMVGLNLFADYFFTENFSLGVEQAGAWNFANGRDENGEDNDDGLIGRSVASADYHLGGWLPYVGANIGYIYGEGLEDDLIYGPEIGLDLGFLSGKLAYDFRADEDAEDGVISATLGGSYRW
ncbi:MAG: OmpA family protein [Geminicoccaceae bacterium]